MLPRKLPATLDPAWPAVSLAVCIPHFSCLQPRKVLKFTFLSSPQSKQYLLAVPPLLSLYYYLLIKALHIIPIHECQCSTLKASLIQLSNKMKYIFFLKSKMERKCTERMEFFCQRNKWRNSNENGVQMDLASITHYRSLPSNHADCSYDRRFRDICHQAPAPQSIHTTLQAFDSDHVVQKRWRPSLPNVDSWVDLRPIKAIV